MDTISEFWAGAQDVAEKMDLEALALAAGGWETLTRCGVFDLIELGVAPEVAKRWLSTPPRQTRGRAVTRASADYPPELLKVGKRAPVLFVEGDIGALHRPCVAVVGTRRCTPYGAAIARHLGTALGRQGITTVSGLARGIDAHAHRGALGSGLTVAVLGHGLAHTAPASNIPLREALLERGGAVISTFPDDREPARWTFPSRNRWIIGVSSAVVVVEAPQQSGAMITARLAEEIERTVYVVPGPVGVWACQGSNSLLESYGIPLLDVDGFARSVGMGHMASDVRAPWLQLLLTGAPLEDVARLRGCSALTVLDDVARLELAGEVVRLPGGRYARGGGL